MRKWGIATLLLLLISGCSKTELLPITGIIGDDPIVYYQATQSPTTSVFTGKTVYGDTYQAVGVMFENTVAARPQSGISLAEIGRAHV